MVALKYNSISLPLIGSDLGVFFLSFEFGSDFDWGYFFSRISVGLHSGF